MNISDLEQYLDLQKEILSLEKRLERLIIQGTQVLADAVKGSLPCFPYIERSVKIRGLDDSGFGQRDKLRGILVRRKKRLEKKRLEIEEFIDTLQDSKLRQIITMHYIEDKNWRSVATKIYGYPCEDRPRKKVIRFFEKI